MLSKICVVVIFFFVSGTDTQLLDTSGFTFLARYKDNMRDNPCVKKIRPLAKMKNTVRISQRKCAEYVGELWARQQASALQEDCILYKADHKLPIPVFYGGYGAKQGEFPHMVALGWRTFKGDWAFKCGGTLVSTKFVLTAGHCTLNVGDSNIINAVPEIVRMGSTNLAETDRLHQDVHIHKIIKHPNYAPPQKYNDLAIVELKNKVTISSTVQPACLWTAHSTRLLNTKVSSAGWGATDRGSKKSQKLQAGELDLINSDLCSKLLNKFSFRLWRGLRPHQICAGKLAGGVDTCQGDSGGPLQAILKLPKGFEAKMYYVLGVTSFGFGCARRNSPGLYTRVSSFIDWIEDIVWAHDH